MNFPDNPDNWNPLQTKAAILAAEYSQTYKDNGGEISGYSIRDYLRRLPREVHEAFLLVVNMDAICSIIHGHDATTEDEFQEETGENVSINVPPDAIIRPKSSWQDSECLLCEKSSVIAFLMMN